MLANKTVVLGITGSIAAYKAADIASKLTQAGARVEVIMTESATRFVAPLTLRNITGRPVVTGMWDLASEFSVEHVALAEAADIVVIAPATANIIARVAAGIADDMLSCTVLATKAPVIVAPAMNVNMFQNTITQENLAKLKARGFTIVDPACGRLASGAMGLGRLPETDTVIGIIQQVLGRGGDLAGKRIVVTAGGTQEPIDPVRHISNRSSGKMGYALAEAARDRGAGVTLITAPTSLAAPAGMEVVPVNTAAEMKEAVTKAITQADAMVMAAAVADYQAKEVSPSKIKKETAGLTLELVRTPDILSEVKGNFLRVGFAAESENVVENARHKLQKKQLDIIVANDITATDSGFGTDTNKVTLICQDGKEESLPLLSKREVADKILDRVVGMMPALPPVLTGYSFESTVRDSYKDGYIHVPKASWHLFPEINTILELEIDKEYTIQTGCYIGKVRGFWSKNIKEWYKTHRELKLGSKLLITAIKPMKKYRLEVIK